MRRIVFALALLTAGPAYAAEICFDSNPCRHVTYEHAFNVESERSYSQRDLSESHPWATPPLPFEEWTIPPFDFSAGIPEVLLLDIEGTLTISGRIPDLDGHSDVTFFANFIARNFGDDTGTWLGGGYATCTAAPCDFLIGPWEGFESLGFMQPTPDRTGWDVPPWVIDSPAGFTVQIPTDYTTNTFFDMWTTYFPDGSGGEPVYTPLTLRTEITGVARATYFYEPVAVPEPTTLLLLGSGLIGAVWKRWQGHA